MGTEVESLIVIDKEDIHIPSQGLQCSLQIGRRRQHSKARGEIVERACGLHNHQEESHCWLWKGPVNSVLLDRQPFCVLAWLWVFGILLR